MRQGEEVLREMMYQVISQMVEDGELVPVYDDGELVDILVNLPDPASRNT